MDFAAIVYTGSVSWVNLSGVPGIFFIVNPYLKEDGNIVR
jgi:hypothetical protein